MAGKSQSRSRQTEAVEEAARARIDDDAPAPAGGDEDATEGEAGESGIAVAREFEGTNFELSEEQLAEVIGQTSGDEDAEGLLGRIGRDAVAKGAPGEDLLGGGEDSEPEAPLSDRPAAFEAGPGVREAGVFDLIDQPGASDGDPLSSFLGAVEAKLGRDLGLAPSDAASDANPTGKDSIADAGNGITVTRGRELSTQAEGGKAIGDALGIETYTSPDDYRQFIEVKDTNNGTITRVYDNGATTTTTLDGKKIDSTPGLTAPVVSTEPLPAAKTTQEIEEKKKQEEEDKKKEEDKKEEEESEGEPSKESTPDEDFVVPEELMLDPEVQRLRKLREQGPDSGDGATDPSEIESEVVGAAGELPTHAELGESLFGQPDTTIEVGGGGGNVNPGADSQGAGVITPQDDQNVATGPRRNDDPFDAVGPAPKPVAAADEAGADEGSESFLPPSEIESPVDAPGDDLPDAIFDPSAP